LPYGDLDTPAQAASAAQAVPVAKAPPVTKPEKVSAASASDDRADSESVVDEFFVNNVEEIRQAAAESRVLLEKPIDSQNQCVLWVQGTVFPALREAGAKPANKVLDLDGITVWRMVTTDGPVTATCSGPDRKFVLQSHF
jgi:hypothetical protein